MKKILYLVTQAEWGGAQHYVFDLAVNLKNEFEVAVAVGEPGETGELCQKLKQEQIKYFVIPHLKRAILPISDLLALKKIYQLIKQFQPDIIHLNSSKISILGSLAAKLVKWSKARLPACAGGCRQVNGQLSIIYTVHGWVFNEPLPLCLKWFYKWAEKWTANFKDKIICVSEFDRQVAIQQKIAPAAKLITIHHGLAPINFLAKEQARMQLSLAPEQLIIGSIGNLYPTKGYQYLIKAAKIIKDSGYNLTTVVIGQGDQKKYLEKQIKQLGLENSFILKGEIKQAARLLPAFDFYVCSSVKEGLSYTILEARQAGLPIVATAVGGNPELITDGQNGLLVPVQNPQALADKIIRLLKSPDLPSRLASQAQKDAPSKFSLAKMLGETKKVYQSS